MEIEIKKQRDTPLLSRKRVSAMVSFEGATPSRAKLRAGLAKQLKVDEELTIVKHIYTRYGNEKAKVIAHVYSNAKDRDTVEDEYLLKKHVKKEEPKEEKKEEAPAATPVAPTEAASAEAPTTDAPAEEKKEAAAAEPAAEPAAEKPKAEEK